MKIEMGESLVYSWLRHVMGCQIVQINWKVSPSWYFDEKKLLEIEKLKDELETCFSQNYGFSVFKKNHSLEQILKQTECDAIGISCNINGDCNNHLYFYGIEVAFHRDGLNYSDKGKKAIVQKVLAKFIRIAFCLYICFGAKKAQIIFATPKIQKHDYERLSECLLDLNKKISELLPELKYTFSFYANESFKNVFLDNVLLIKDQVNDTSELFLRSIQLYKMFY